MALQDYYTLGTGEVYFGQFADGTSNPRGERLFGNVPAFNLTASQEKLDHFSSMRGVRTKDASVLLQLDYSGTMECDTISPENLAVFFLGDSSTLTATSTPVAGEAINDIEKGLTYQIGTSSTNPAGVRKISAVTVKKGASTLVAGTDYTVDLTLARLTILTTSVTLTNGDDLTVDYTIDASTRDRVISKSKTIEGSLRFVASNPSGKLQDYFMPWVKVTPNGDFPLIGEEWLKMSFNVEVLKKGTLEALYIDGRPA